MARKVFELSREALDAVARRVIEIRDLCILWTEVTGKDVEALNRAINKKWSVTDGINALTFESIAHIRDSLTAQKKTNTGE